MSDHQTLVLVGHGSRTELRAFSPTFSHADAIRETGRFDRVCEAFLKAGPTIDDVMAPIEDGEVVVVPLFISEGYYTEEVIPRALDDHRRAGVTIHYTPPVGTHGAMTDVILNRVDSAVGDRRDGIGLALVGHGSERNPNSADAVRRHASHLRERTRFEDVQSFFLEEAPLVDELPRPFDTNDIVVVPVFMAEGHHVSDDIPERIGIGFSEESPSETDAHRVWYTDPVGTDPTVADIALERAQTALMNTTEEEPPRSSPDDRSGNATRTRL